jgi:transposase
MPRHYSPQVRRRVIELARAGTKVRQLARTFEMSEATIYGWLKQDRIDRGEAEGAATGQQLELAAARRRIGQLETELAVARKVNEVVVSEGVAPKAVRGDRVPDRAGNQRATGLRRARGLAVGLLRLEGRPDAPRTLRRIRWPARSPTSTRRPVVATARCA